MKQTKTFEVGGITCCSYCGAKAKSTWSYHNHRPDEEYFYCECDNAKLELNITDEISKVKRNVDNQIYSLKEKIPQENRDMINNMMFDYELNALKRKYKLN